MPIYVFVEQVAEVFRPTGVAGLRTKGAEPHEVAGLNFHPVFVEFVDALLASADLDACDPFATFVPPLDHRDLQALGSTPNSSL